VLLARPSWWCQASSFLPSVRSSRNGANEVRVTTLDPYHWPWPARS
jgi:hypothetical protein